MAGSISVPAGLDYNAVKIVTEQLDIDLSPGDFQKIQLLERLELERIKRSVENGYNNGRTN